MGKKSKKGNQNRNNKKKNQQRARAKARKEAEAPENAVDATAATPEPTPEPESKPEPEVVEAVAPVESTKSTNDEPVAEVEAEAVADANDDVEEKVEAPVSYPELESSLDLLTESQKNLAYALCSSPTNQSHVFQKWSESTDNEKKVAVIEQLERMDSAYPSGGLVGYIENAKELLERSRKGENPLEGWSPSVPSGERFEIGTDNFDTFEQKGMSEVGKCGFVLVAGGLGERLGYGGIKLGLPTELATETLYLQLYIETILAIQAKHAAPDVKLPLCIMVSNDTHDGTIQLLKENNNFGMDESQITIVQQGDGVPALMDNNATIAMDESDPLKIQAKPHGHGDIHALLHSNDVAKDWCANGLEWVIFCQDTNGLAFHTLPLALGVSKELDLIMNSIAVPRKAKQAIGGIAKLSTATGDERTINVEYNQLDPLLRSSGYPDGDVNDETGYSPYPGNINQLLFQLQPYKEALDRTQGAMPEFVNPKYADSEKTIFKKPTRLECMMQDFPTVLEGDDAKRVGFTSIAADLCFSPVKNATADGVVVQQKGVHPGVAATGEADQYAAIRKIMTSVGCQVEESETTTFSGISVVPGPEIVLKPSFVSCPADYKDKFPQPEKIKISGRSSLVVNGSGVVIESLELDGALIIECEDGAPSGVIKDVVVTNKGWEKVTDVSSDSPEYIRIRGYHLNKIETQKIVFKKDGTVEGMPEKKESTPMVTVESSEDVVEVISPVNNAKSRSSAVAAPVVVAATTPSPAVPAAADLSAPAPATTPKNKDNKADDESQEGGCLSCVLM